ncbi:glutathione binding-like protein [Xanthomonas axonopodis]|uniref:glutathione binding-like protein n=1 Tax=Xanthomonas axonopodis TaxID=53413 RepID=UPI003556DCEA
MIHLYSWPTPNGQKIQILLEELGCPYQAHPVNILRGEQFAEDFLLISPNNKIPAIVDEDAQGASVSVFETGAILLYLAEKFGRFLPTELPKRTEVLEWLFFQSASLGPMLGQSSHFRRYAAEPVPYAVQRYTAEANRLYGVLERRLAERDWLAAGEYSIADIGAFPWICRSRRQGVDIEEYPLLKGWLARVSARPAVGRGMDVLKEIAVETPLDAKAHETLFKA